MKKVIILLLVLTVLFSFTSCKTHPQESSSITKPISSTVTSVYSKLESSEETITSTVSQEDVSSTVSKPEPLTSATQSTTSSNVSTTSSNVTAPSNCTHPDYWNGHTGLHWIGGLRDLEPGIENTLTLYAPCEEPREVVYKCPICLEPVLKETLEPTGHDFSGDEEVILYPTIANEGSWGKTCQASNCLETMLTTPIPKRGGIYNTVAPCFTISGNDYEIDNPSMIIMDRRTWGDVPTIVFDTATYIGTISYVKKDGTLYQSAIEVDKTLLSEGWRYKGTILETGVYDVQYSRWGAWDGAASNNN